MAESGGVSGILGTESETPAELSIPETLTQLDPTAAALAAEASKSDPELAKKASAYFDMQSHLVEIQTEHLHEQRAVNLQLLKLRGFDERLRVGLRLFVILVATVIGIGGAVLIHDAVTSRSVVVEPFEAPRVLAERGLTGTVVASGVLDQLTRLQAATRSSMQRRNLSNAWSKEIKLTVPETGLSIGEISQLLKGRFSNGIHISGDVVQTEEAGGLEITVRGDALLPGTFTGASDQLAKLTTEVAEYVYSQSQPALWAAYLVNSGRYQDAITFCELSISSSPLSEHSGLLNYWAIAISKSSGAGPLPLALIEKAIALQPDYWYAYNELTTVKIELGDEEGAWRVGEDLRKAAGGRPGRAPEVDYGALDSVTWNLPGMLAGLTADAQSTSGNGTLSFSAGPQFALVEALMHDPASAELALQTTKPDAGDPTIIPFTHFVHSILMADSGNSARALDEMEAFLSNDTISENVGIDMNGLLRFM